MASLYDDVQKQIQSADTSTYRTRDGERIVRSAKKFKPLDIKTQDSINRLVENDQKKAAIKIWGKSSLRSLSDIREGLNDIGRVVTNVKDSRGLTARTMDMFRTPSPIGYGGNGGISNYSTQSGVMGQDPNMSMNVGMNVWLSPQEATTVYSQKGVPEVIIRKKSQSIMLNSVRIENPRLKPLMLDRINEDTYMTGLDIKIAEAVRDSLTYGGALLFPMFKFDNPATMGLPISTLAKLGLLTKGMLSHFVILDRWNVVHTPSYNPTSRDFMTPNWFFIPFLGSDVHSSRTARIVTAPQAGYWGQMITYGWGLSDIPGWIEAVYKYYSVMQTIPTMINQMSILARTINIDGILATEGAAILDELAREDTIRAREISPSNPINFDVVGDLKAIQRDFAQVPELVRLMRQDVGAKAAVPEELIWSSERGAFASGDTTDSAYEKQSEGTRYIHVDVARQLKAIAQLAVINAIGFDEEIAEALPYTTISFDNPRVTNAKDKADIAGKITKGYFDMVAAGIPRDTAIKISQDFADDEFHVSNELMETLKDRQAIDDAREEEKHIKEMELLDAQIQATFASATASAEGSTPAKKKGIMGGKKKDDDDEKKGHSYEDPMEQRKHEKIGGSKRQSQGMQKAEAKKVGE